MKPGSLNGTWEINLSTYQTIKLYREKFIQNSQLIILSYLNCVHHIHTGRVYKEKDVKLWSECRILPRKAPDTNVN